MGPTAKLRCANCGSRCRLLAALVALAAWSVVEAAPVLQLTAEQPTDFGPKDAWLFLHRYGYLDDSDSKVSSTREESFKEALTTYQRFSGLPITGTLDAATKKMMQVPRCGMKDINPPGHGGRRQKRYALDGSKFPKHHLTYRLLNHPPRFLYLWLTHALDALERATAMWSSASTLTFSPAPLFQPADIDISFEPRVHLQTRRLVINNKFCKSFDGPRGVVAHARNIYGRAVIHFDGDELWTPSNLGENFFQVAVHELGHVLGLDHSDKPNAVMAPVHTNKRKFRLHSDDIAGIQALYGSFEVREYRYEDGDEDEYEEEE